MTLDRSYDSTTGRVLALWYGIEAEEDRPPAPEEALAVLLDILGVKLWY